MLRIFRPADELASPGPLESESLSPPVGSRPEEEDGPVLLNFQEYTDRRRRHSPSPLQRAQQIHANCECPACHAALIIPLVLNDGRRACSGEEVPGTATLVGFRCDVCSAEWPA